MNDPYKTGMFKENPYHAKSDVCGELRVVLAGRYEERGLSLIAPVSRCVCRHEVHELIVSDEETIGPGVTVNRIAYIGFAEITAGGVIIAGDEVTIDGQKIGVIAGFDLTHMPNHLNIVIKSDGRQSGAERGLLLNSSVVFRQVITKGIV